MRKILLILLLFLMTVIPASATNYYVRTDGNNACNGLYNNGGSSGNCAWRNIDYAADSARPVTAGDTVYVGSGEYNEDVTFDKSGTAGNYITFVSQTKYGAIIDGTGAGIGNTWGSGVVIINNKDYINISGFEIRDSPYWGIGVHGGSSYITIHNNYIHATASSGILADGMDHLTVSYNNMTNVQTLAGGIGQDNEGFSLINVNTFNIEHNIMWDQANFETIDVKFNSIWGDIHSNDISGCHSACIYLDAYGGEEYENNVYHNWLHDSAEASARGIAIAAESTGGNIHDIDIFNNFIDDMGAEGIDIAHYSVGPVNNIIINSNTINRGGQVSSWGGGFRCGYASATNVHFRNNIVSNSLNYQIRVDGSCGATVTNNLIYSYLGYSGETRGTYYVEGNPQFTGTGEPPFRLTSGSPARDAGTATEAPTTDYFGIARPQGSGYDIGAAEFEGSVPTPTPQPTTTPPGGFSIDTRRVAGYTVWGYELYLADIRSLIDALWVTAHHLQVDDLAGTGDSAFVCTDSSGTVFRKSTPCSQ